MHPSRVRSCHNVLPQRKPEIEGQDIVTSIKDKFEYVPEKPQLFQNYPNPFNPSTVIRYSLPYRENVTLAVYDALGQRIALLINRKQQSGYHEIVFRKLGLSSGVYFYRLKAGDFVDTKKLLLLK